MTMRLVEMHNAHIVWMYCLDPVSGWWCASCDGLGLTAAGKTFEEMTAEIPVAMEALFRILITEGAFQAFLEERGWERVQVPARVSVNRLKFDIPYQVQQAPASMACQA